MAGSRGVVASNWLMDDEVAASVVREFCASVAAGRKAGTVDYADEDWEEFQYYGYERLRLPVCRR